MEKPAHLGTPEGSPENNDVIVPPRSHRTNEPHATTPPTLNSGGAVSWCVSATDMPESASPAIDRSELILRVDRDDARALQPHTARFSVFIFKPRSSGTRFALPTFAQARATVAISEIQCMQLDIAPHLEADRNPDAKRAKTNRSSANSPTSRCVVGIFRDLNVWHLRQSTSVAEM